MSAVRFVQLLVVANAVMLIVQSVRVIAVYSAVHSLIEDRAKRQLPLHVWLIATSYLLYVLGTTYFIFTTPEPNGLARAILYAVSGLIGQYALWNVLSFERRRYSKVTSFIDDEA